MEQKIIQVVPDRWGKIANEVKSRAGNKIVSPSFLRLEVLAENAKGQYSFSVKKDVGTAFPTEKKLDINDAFVIVDMGFYLSRENVLTPGVSVLQTYPNVIYFPAEAGNVTNEHLESFYNGSARIKVNDTTFIEGIDTQSSRVVRTTQQTAATNESERLTGDGLQQLPRTITLLGSDKNEIELNVPSFSGQQVQYVTAPEKVRLVLFCKGFLITGGSNLGNLQ